MAEFAHITMHKRDARVNHDGLGSRLALYSDKGASLRAQSSLRCQRERSSDTPDTCKLTISPSVDLVRL
jgi:hypothetical protein